MHTCSSHRHRKKHSHKNLSFLPRIARYSCRRICIFIMALSNILIGLYSVFIFYTTRYHTRYIVALSHRSIDSFSIYRSLFADYGCTETLSSIIKRITTRITPTNGTASTNPHSPATIPAASKANIIASGCNPSLSPITFGVTK